MLTAFTVAGLAAGIAAVADSKPWATVIWAGVGGVGTAFAPTLWEYMRDRRDAVEALEGTAEIPPVGPASLLHPLRAVVPFAGRERELSELLTWCCDPDTERLRLLVGPGGVGKSRLALELAVRLGPSWGFLGIRDDAETEALSRWRSVSEDRVLLVVDYAETRTDLAALLLDVVSDTDRQVRVLLLARSAGEWWQQLGAQAARVRQMVAAAGDGLVLAEAVRESAADHQLVLEAVPHFAAALGVAAPEWVDVELGEGPQRILDLHAAALAAVLRSTSAEHSRPVTVRVADVLMELLGHERRYWLQTAQARGFLAGAYGMSPLMVEQTVAAGTLLGARDREQACDVVGRVPDATASVRVADWLRELYPPDDGRGWLGRLHPDRLAEFHVTYQLCRSPALLSACLEDLDSEQGRRALVMLARAAQELDPAAEILQQLLPAVAAEAGSVAAPRETLVALYEVLPSESVILANTHLLLAQRILDSIPNDSEAEERARWLSLVGMHLTALGRPTDALTAHQEAVTYYRNLADENPALYRADLARSVGSLGTCLSQLGRSADALTAAKLAANIYIELVEHQPARYYAPLANALSHLGVQYSELGHHADALDAIELAVSIFRTLVESRPNIHRSDLAESLSNLGACFSAMGRHTEGRLVLEEAVSIYRDMAEDYPDRYRPELARALANLSMGFEKVRQTPEALTAAQEATALYRELVERYPDRYNHYFAGCLASLGSCLWRLGRISDALAAEKEAVRIRRAQAVTYPDRHRSDLAIALSNLSATLSSTNCLPEALEAIEEAVIILRELPTTYSEGNRADFADALSNLGATLSRLNRPTEALPVIQEASDIYRDLVERYPIRYLPDLARSLSHLAACLAELGYTEESKRIEEELNILDST
ncbi:tetratricopeptide repeat protein [Nonomuraea africana]|uniref:Tetratricopeptide (TPR) repeat protein n=1 Tax=Nonomuraea africana TaxID=46171 RepID=A0ABR9KRF5_9ACTN|nr:tetratricopeptide repeat protein [Nonomuraea africana]MBE1564594.1 tetratricopeptide (TPR) repeat protein [Nonomuraea africana]